MARLLPQTSEHDGPITCLAQSDQYIFTGSADALCHIWDKDKPQFPVFSLQGHTEEVTTVAILRGPEGDGHMVVTGSLDRCPKPAPLLSVHHLSPVCARIPTPTPAPTRTRCAPTPVPMVMSAPCRWQGCWPNQERVGAEEGIAG